MDDDTRKIPSLGSILITMLLGVVALGLTALLILGGLAANKSHHVRAGWEAALGSLDEVLERYPRTDANAAALELERLTAVLGIDMASRSFEGRDRPTRSQMLAFRDVKRDTWPWLNSQLSRSHRNLDPPPETLSAYLSEHDGRIEAVRRHLAEGPPPAWEMHLDKLWEAPIPNLLGHMDLQKLLLADALVRARVGDPDGAARDLEASWRLSLALRDSPILITQLVSMAATRMQAGTLRQLTDVPPIWRARLVEQDHRAAFLTALRYAGWSWSEAGDARIFGGDPGLAQRITAAVARPYVRYCVADLSGRFRERIERLSHVQALCDADFSGSEADLDLPIPRWNLIGDSMVPNLGSAIYRVARLEVDLELTIRLLELDAAVEKRRGSYQSSACPGDRWIYRVAADGTASIALSREVTWPDLVGVVLPTEFRL